MGHRAYFDEENAILNVNILPLVYISHDRESMVQLLSRQQPIASLYKSSIHILAR